MGNAQAADKAINFGIMSTESSQNLKSIWQPFLDDMHKKTGLTINATFASDYAGLIQGMRFNKVDVAWLGNKAAMEAVEQVLQKHLRDQSGHNGIPMPVRVPSPIDLNGRAVLDLGDRQVQVIASLLLPRVVVLGGLLSHEECDALVEASRHKLSRSTTVDMESGGNMVHPDRTSEGTYFNRGEDELCTRIEARIARLEGQLEPAARRR